MRLHFLIFSALAGVPFAALPYASKVTGFLQELHIPDPPLEHMSAGELIANIDRAWDLRHEQRARTELALGELRARAKTNTELALGLLSRTRSTR
jgi:polysaccharide pyruvyl transferase WcaK-like protein